MYDRDPDLKRLIASHPSLFRSKAPKASSYVLAGWRDLLDQLCRDIEAELGPQDCAHLEVEQIKEKLGALRFHYRFRRLSEKESQVRDLVYAACERSKSICERCGAAAVLCELDSGRTALCDQHFGALRRM